MTTNPILRLFFEEASFDTMNVFTKGIRRHYAFVECEECVTLNQKVAQQYPRFKHRFDAPCYWLETQKDETRAVFGHVTLEDESYSNEMKVFHFSTAKIGGGKRSIAPKDTENPYTYAVTHKSDSTAELLYHLYEHYNLSLLETMLQNPGGLPAMGTTWTYLKPKKEFPAISEVNN